MRPSYLLPPIVLLLSLTGLARSPRPPSVPLVTHDPYFSIWSPADKLTDADTVHWTGKPHRLCAMVRIDGRTFRLMGAQPADTPALPQTDVDVLPTRTSCGFQGGGVAVRIDFAQPILPGDLEVATRPVTRMSFAVSSQDGRPHEVAFYFDASAEIAVNEPSQRIDVLKDSSGHLDILEIRSVDQPVLAKRGDDLRIDWGTLLVAAPQDKGVVTRFLGAATARGVFAGGGEFPMVKMSMPVAASDAPVAAVAFPAQTVKQGESAERRILIAYDDEFSIRYFRQNLRPYWKRNGMTAHNMLEEAWTQEERHWGRGPDRDRVLIEAIGSRFGEKYAGLCTLAYRQTWAGNKIVADANGQPLMFPKENFSNGCIGTVDVLFPQCPFFLALSPALTKAMLVPVLDYAASPRWPYPYAPHDLGTYPHATGQVYGMNGSDADRMPVEECGNMLIMLAALAKLEGNADFSKTYQPMLRQWADFLVKEGLDPKNQLCSADMFGHLPRNANLALKAVIGIGAYGQLCAALGLAEEGKRYADTAKRYAREWCGMAKDDGHTVLAYEKPGTWSAKHNLIWDRILGLNLIPQEIGDAEVAWYKKVQGKYGLPVDSRTNTCLIDWAMWSIACARNDDDFQALVEPLWNYANETPSRVPLGDWFVTTDAKQKAMQARPVVGGLFIKLLTDDKLWKEWAATGTNTKGPWAPIPIGGAFREVLSSAPKDQPEWRYTTAVPPADWMNPGFDDSKWGRGKAGFGTQGTPGATLGTEWKTKEIWLRREFTLPPQPLKNPRLRLIYDESPEVWLNGVPAAKLGGWVTQYEEADIAPEARATLKPGKNVIAVKATQTTGGQCIDVGLVEDAPPGTAAVPNRPLPLRRLLDSPMRDTSICVGPDRSFYLTGTTGTKTGGQETKDGWWHVNEGVRVWKSPDLTNWEPLGLVWSFTKDATWQKPKDGRLALWAPDIHFLKGTFWITYCINTGGTGLLKSTSGKAEGPYVDVKLDGPLTAEIDPSLFQDDDGRVYFVFQNGKIARMKDDMSGLAEEPRLLKPANSKHVGFEGAFLTKMDGRYQLVCAEFNRRDGINAYDCMVASSEHLYGPYGDRYLALPTAGHNMFFKDPKGQWWATYFGNDPQALWRERPGILPIRLDAEGRIVPMPNPTQP